MNQTMWDMDDPLLLELAGVMERAEPIPVDVVWQAKTAIAWRDISAHIAELEYDSIIDDDERFARVRGVASAERVLRFRGADAVAQLVVLDGGRRLVGQLEPASFRSVEVRRPSGSTLIEVDREGNFLVERLARGPVSLRCLPANPAAAPFETEWVAI